MTDGKGNVEREGESLEHGKGIEAAERSARPCLY